MDLDGTSNGLISIGTEGNCEKITFRIAIALAEICTFQENVTGVNHL
jgi:hypothetical protein